MGNIININNGQTAEFPWAASEPIKLTFNVAGFNSLGWAPHGTAIIEYYDPFSNEILVKSVPIGGSRYATEVSVVTGSLNGEGIGAVKITVTDNQDYVTPVSNLPVAQIPEILKTILKQASVIDKVVSGNFSSSGYTVSEIGFESAAEFELSAYVDYAPGFLESKGITPDNLPDGFKAKFDYFGNFTGVEFEEDDDEVIETNGEENEKCFAAGTQIDMADGTQKPIETIQVGDKVMAYDPAENAGRGGLKPARVTRTMVNQVPHLLDFHGVKVTPGHATLCGDVPNEGKHIPLMDILLADGAVVNRDGALLRAATNLPVGSEGDQFVEVAWITFKSQKTFFRGWMRAGTLTLDAKGKTHRVLDALNREGYRLLPDGLIAKDGETPHPLYWFGELPKPADYVLAKSDLTLAELYSAEGQELARPAAPASSSKIGAELGAVYAGMSVN